VDGPERILIRPPPVATTPDASADPAAAAGPAQATAAMNTAVVPKAPRRTYVESDELMCFLRLVTRDW
jgi:hypothetical protein